MKKIIYIEKGVKNRLRVKKIIKRFKDPTLIYMTNTQKYLIKRNQNFIIQKNNPAIILAKK